MRNVTMLAAATLLVACGSEPSASAPSSLRSTGQAHTPEPTRDRARAGVAAASSGGEVELERLAVALRSGRLREVVAGATALRESMATEPTVHLLLGDALIGLGHYQRAVESYQDALDLSPDTRSYVRGARARWTFGDIDGAIELMEDAMQSTSDRSTAARLFAELGSMFLDAGRREAADRAARRAAELEAGEPEVIALRARLAELGDDWLRADELWTQLAVSAPSARAFLGAYRARRVIGRTDAAIAMLDRALAVREREPLAVAMQLVADGNRPALALQLARLAHRRSPTIEAEHALAMALLRAHRPTEALVHAMRATRLGTPSAELWIGRAAVETELGLASQAAASMARAGRIESNYLVATGGL